jgi:uncharacterized MAPEG superfamily protein
MNAPILAPAAVLVLWSMVILIWTSATRFPAIGKVPRDNLKGLPRKGVRGQDLEAILPPNVNWVSHNYTHLMEQPTVFYAVVCILALAGAGSGVNLWLAWAYVAIRIVHSLWQVLVNTIPVRIALFGVSSLCLIALAVNGVRATIFG